MTEQEPPRRAPDDPQTVAAYLLELYRALEVGTNRRLRILAEVEAHLADHVAALERRGLANEEAQAAAVAAFGPAAVVAERFGSDVAGMALQRTLRLGARLDVWRARHPVLGAPASGFAPLAPFFVVAAWSVGRGRVDVVAFTATAVYVPNVVVQAITAWLVRGRPEPGFTGRRRAWADRRPRVAALLSACPMVVTGGAVTLVGWRARGASGVAPGFMLAALAIASAFGAKRSRKARCADARHAMRLRWLPPGTRWRPWQSASTAVTVAVGLLLTCTAVGVRGLWMSTVFVVPVGLLAHERMRRRLAALAEDRPVLATSAFAALTSTSILVGTLLAYGPRARPMPGLLAGVPSFVVAAWMLARAKRDRLEASLAESVEQD